MSGHTPWREVRATLAPEVQEGIDALTASYRLRDLREARGLTQAEVADRLEIRQVSVSRLESRSDVRVSTLRSVIEAMGGRMEIRALFADAEYIIEIGDEVEVRPAPGVGRENTRDA